MISSTSKMFPGVFYALLAGFLGAVASSSAKLSLGADYLKGVCETGLRTWGGEDRIIRQADETTACDWLHIPLRLLCGGLLFTCNAVMWTFFAKALRYSSSSARATVTTTASNFISSAFLGQLIFGETHAALWWVGISLTLSGLLVLHKSAPRDAQPALAKKDDWWPKWWPDTADWPLLLMDWFSCRNCYIDGRGVHWRISLKYMTVHRSLSPLSTLKKNEIGKDFGTWCFWQSPTQYLYISLFARENLNCSWCIWILIFLKPCQHFIIDQQKLKGEFMNTGTVKKHFYSLRNTFPKCSLKVWYILFWYQYVPYKRKRHTNAYYVMYYSRGMVLRTNKEPHQR